MSKLWITVRKADFWPQRRLAKAKEMFWDFVAVDQHCTAIIGEFRAAKQRYSCPLSGSTARVSCSHFLNRYSRWAFSLIAVTSIPIECSTTELEKCPL